MNAWKRLLANPGPDGHIVQLYQDPEFYAEAISVFTAEGLAKGDSVILVATALNWRIISRRLARKGVKVADLTRRGQLTLLDADHTLPKFIVNDMPDGKTFKGIARATIKKARADGKYAHVRWWGEMVNVLYVNGNEAASTRIEEFFDEIAHEETTSIFCSFLMDKFDGSIYNGPIGNVCRTHAHLIPSEDYVVHRECVDQAVRSVLGGIEGPLLDILVASKRWTGTQMPSSQALLHWIKEAAPEKFDEVLSVAWRYEQKIQRRRLR